MNAGTEFQIIVCSDGKPAFVVVPYDQFRRMRGGYTQGAVPSLAVNLSFERGVSPMAAWREYVHLAQAEVAERMGIEVNQQHWQARRRTLAKVASGGFTSDPAGCALPARPC